MKKIFLAILLTSFIASLTTNAQESLFSVQYSVGFPVGNLKDFNSSASFRGINFEYRYMVQPTVSIGLETGYNLFYNRLDYDTYTQGTRSLSGIQYRYTHAVPVLATADYYLKPDANFNPFVGLGIGTMYVNRDLDMGMFTLENDDWQFVLRPQVGAVISLQGFDFMLAAKYMSGFKSNELDATNYFTLNIGLIF